MSTPTAPCRRCGDPDTAVRVVDADGSTGCCGLCLMHLIGLAHRGVMTLTVMISETATA